jgi:hypothetical protein
MHDWMGITSGSISRRLPGLVLLRQEATPHHEHDAWANRADGTEAGGWISWVAGAAGADQTVCGNQIAI